MLYIVCYSRVSIYPLSISIKSIYWLRREGNLQFPAYFCIYNTKICHIINTVVFYTKTKIFHTNTIVTRSQWMHYMISLCTSYAHMRLILLTALYDLHEWFVLFVLRTYYLSILKHETLAKYDSDLRTKGSVPFYL